MPAKLQRITPFFWFNDQAETAVAYYTSIFERSKILSTLRYDKESAAASGRPAGSVLTIAFQLDGQDFTAMNGGPHVTFNQAMSLVVNCESQDEIDHFWNRLSAGGDERAQQCGWLKDRFGVSWQVTPRILLQLIADPDPDKAAKAMHAMMQMKKIDIAALRKAVS